MKKGSPMRSTAKKTMKLLQRGFTLIELLIVVIILAILAAIVIPQFSSATSDANEAALDSNLTALRSAIDLYRAQHGGNYPGALAATGLTCTLGAAGTGTAGQAQAVRDQLTQYSNAAGATCSGADTQTKLGPYLRKGIPADISATPSSTILVTTTGAPIVATASSGWAYDTKTGQFLMNNSALLDSKGQAFSTH